MRSITLANRYKGLSVDKARLKAIVALLDANADSFQGGCPDGELSIVLLDDLSLASLHDRFLDDPSTTDVITFEGDSLLGQAGEICVSADTARKFARRHHRDWREELLLYVIHGWLHLAGYDDLRPALKRIMRRAEARAMRLAASLEPHRVFALRTLAAHPLEVRDVRPRRNSGSSRR